MPKIRLPVTERKEQGAFPIDPLCFGIACRFLCDVEGSTGADIQALAESIQNLGDTAAQTVEDREQIKTELPNPLLAKKAKKA